MNAAGVLRRATAAVALAALAGCATVPAGAPTAKPDPWENWNRKVYAFNEGLDKAVLKVDERNVNMTPGMAVTTEIATGQRRLITFFLDPLRKTATESLRER